MRKSYFLYFILYTFFHQSVFCVQQDCENNPVLIKAHIYKLSNNLELINNFNILIQENNSENLHNFIWQILDNLIYDDLSEEQKSSYNCLGNHANDLI